MYSLPSPPVRHRLVPNEILKNVLQFMAVQNVYFLWPSIHVVSLQGSAWRRWGSTRKKCKRRPTAKSNLTRSTQVRLLHPICTPLKFPRGLKVRLSSCMWEQCRQRQRQREVIVSVEANKNNNSCETYIWDLWKLLLHSAGEEGRNIRQTDFPLVHIRFLCIFLLVHLPIKLQNIMNY